MDEKNIVLVGAGFVGINAAKDLAKSSKLCLTVIDRSNHHLFQPLLYQVAAAGLSPAEIAIPIRSLFSNKDNVKVVQDKIISVDPKTKKVTGANGVYPYDYLILAAGATHNYFGNETGPVLEGDIDGTADRVSYNVDTSGFLTSFNMTEWV